MLSKKDIIGMNREFSNGNIVNPGSLDYAVKTCERNRNWLACAAMLSRAMLIDHVFEDGNKRTSAAVIMLIMDMNGIEFDAGKVPSIVVGISRKNIAKIREIERCIKIAAR
ncbi:hypothetical protein FJZ26_06285 [Candidatus Parvarchaeota archaeon]|nr:hypothetical protein [Candidatus Parvarchaeota archaeon]